MNAVIRISVSYEGLADISKIVDMCDKVIIYEHEKDSNVKTTHIHMLIEGYSRKEDTLRNTIKSIGYKACEFALKVKKEDGGVVDDSFIRYMSKGKLSPKFVKGYTSELIEVRRGEWVEPTRGTIRLQSGKLVKESEDRKQKTKKQLLELMIAEIPDKSSVREILEGIRKVLIRENQVVGMYKVLDYYDSYMMMERKDSWMDGLVSKINSRLGV